MNRNLDRLILAIVSAVTARESYVSKTKLLKLVYLFDVEWYRQHREIYTGFEWKYHLLGPWTAQYDGVYEGLIANAVLTRRKSGDAGFDTEFLTTKEEINLDTLFESIKDEFVLRKVLRVWGEKTTAQILDYIYFQTEPMQNAERGEALDFSSIPETDTPEFRLNETDATPDQIRAARERIAQLRQQTHPPSGGFVSPNYDDVFFEAMELLESKN